MMNSTADEFGENPFRSNDAANEDLFFDATPQPYSPQQQQQQPMIFQQPPVQQQQMFQQQPLQSDPFVLQPAEAMPPMSTFPPPSGPMQTMNQTTQPQAVPSGQDQAPASRSWYGNFLLCLNIETYKAYFDIDADDIIMRVKAVCLDFYKPEHFRNNVVGSEKTESLKGPDLYGPFWITMTLIFFIGVTSNMHDYLHTDNISEFDYDINHLLRAGSVLCAYSFVLPAILWVTTRCMGMQALQLVEWVCIYGYSLVPFMPAVIVCIIPFGIISWVLLLVATIASCSLVLRNVAGPLISADSSQAKAPPVVLCILGCQAIFFLVLKFSFYHHTNPKN